MELEPDSFRFRIRSVVSSTTPGMLENSWWTPLIFTAVIADPSSDESRTREANYPTWCQNPVPVVLP